LSSVVSAILSAGLVVVYAGEPASEECEVLRAIAKEGFFHFPEENSTTTPDEVVHQALSAAEKLRIGNEFKGKVLN